MKKQMILIVLASVIIMAMAGIGVASAEVIELDLGVYKYYQTPKTWTIDVPADAIKVEVTHYDAYDYNKIFILGGWMSYKKWNGLYITRWMSHDPTYYWDYIAGEKKLHPTDSIGKWLDVTSRVNVGVANTLTYYHFTGGPGGGTKVRITTEPPEFPPVADAGPDQTVEQDSLAGASVTLDGSGSNDPDGDLLTYSWTWDDGSATGVNPTVSLPLGTTTITLVVNDGTADSDPDTVVITVQDTTQPVITCPADVTVEQATAAGTVVPLTATATDICDADPTITSDDLAIYPLGSTVVTFTATDDSGNAASCTTTVTVEDTIPPEISVTVSPDFLWPPNHKMVDLTATVTVNDICDAAPTVILTSVTSNEPDDAIGNGDGKTVNDIQGADIDTEDYEFQLRAERAGTGDGRVYTITYTVTDASGNSASASATVVVPHDRG